LEYNGHTVHGYWQLEAAAAQPGQVVRQGTLQTPVGEYHEPDTKVQVFPGKPGDTIVFTGLRTGEDIFLRAVAVLNP
jgi:hypothetical protein